MRNLAGNDRAMNDQQILKELQRCGINSETWDCGRSEVQCSLRGRLVGTVFTRAWTYWMVDTRVPLDMAKRMRVHPVGMTDIRVAGHCGCPAPEAPWITWRDPETGKTFATTQERRDVEKFRGKHPEMREKFVDEHIFHDDPASMGAEGTIDSYHIDTELGLYVFVQFLKGQL